MNKEKRICKDMFLEHFGYRNFIEISIYTSHLYPYIQPILHIKYTRCGVRQWKHY
jgi:hypothetical protein